MGEGPDCLHQRMIVREEDAHRQRRDVDEGSLDPLGEPNGIVIIGFVGARETEVDEAGLVGKGVLDDLNNRVHEPSDVVGVVTSTIISLVCPPLLDFSLALRGPHRLESFSQECVGIIDPFRLFFGRGQFLLESIGVEAVGVKGLEQLVDEGGDVLAKGIRLRACLELEGG